MITVGPFHSPEPQKDPSGEKSGCLLLFSDTNKLPLPINTECPINTVTAENWENCCTLQSVWPNKFCKVTQSSFLTEHQCFFSFISGNMGKSPTPRDRERRKCQCLNGEMRYQRFLMAAPLEWGGNFGRHGSSAPASWEKTESSPEEQVELRVSG